MATIPAWTLRHVASDPVVDDLPTFNALDVHVDALLLECSQLFKEDELKVQASKCMKMDSTLKASSSKQVLAAPKIVLEIMKAKINAVPDRTLTDTNYCVWMSREWCDHRFFNYEADIPGILFLRRSLCHG